LLCLLEPTLFGTREFKTNISALFHLEEIRRAAAGSQTSNQKMR
jgi:hypothetical protein